ncbi:putative non-specific serine/threonine protein kinase [Helianthus anomalus]
MPSSVVLKSFQCLKIYTLNATTPKRVEMSSGSVIDNYMALENIYRLNMGGGQVSVQDDTGVYWSWDQDNNYIYRDATGLITTYHSPIMYTTETPNYTVPELVYNDKSEVNIKNTIE